MKLSDRIRRWWNGPITSDVRHPGTTTDDSDET